ncbi:MAG TPA: 2-amino-4-hydroxy-6-hydroxymethyldihydropteridine diphosphokinase [Syntrophorhabdaceae bacterium]|nr:2-amino-4-hydroxy-6-hydroxymethyldihydropteridine diphosphokinase [Syntrophorhabdaceae bacterium]HNT68098.1 2-amino-4-hydroxy-6-hydroxymethyldihydropteridine diphosphokinase [Syntrophorhabdaceae bacterium]
MQSSVFIGIGSNIGDKIRNCIDSIKAIAHDKRARIRSASSLYLSSPVSEIAQEDFVNCAVSIDWDGAASELLRLLNRIEAEMGRRRAVKNGPRVIDLDILLFGDALIDEASLTVPHPELHRRRFAIVPCIEIEQDIFHPLYKRPLKDFLPHIDDSQKIALLKDRKEVPNFN